MICGSKSNEGMLTTCRPLTIHLGPCPMQEIKGCTIVQANETEMQQNWCVGPMPPDISLVRTSPQTSCAVKTILGKQSAVPTTHSTIIGSSLLS